MCAFRFCIAGKASRILVIRRTAQNDKRAETRHYNGAPRRRPLRSHCIFIFQSERSRPFPTGCRGDSRIARRFRPRRATNVTAAGGGKREHLWAKRSILFGAPSRKQNRVPREGKAVKCVAFDWGRDFFISLPPAFAYGKSHPLTAAVSLCRFATSPSHCEGVDPLRGRGYGAPSRRPLRTKWNAFAPTTPIFHSARKANAYISNLIGQTPQYPSLHSRRRGARFPARFSRAPKSEWTKSHTAVQARRFRPH